MHFNYTLSKDIKLRRNYFFLSTKCTRSMMYAYMIYIIIRNTNVTHIVQNLSPVYTIYFYFFLFFFLILPVLQSSSTTLLRNVTSNDALPAFKFKYS